MIHVREESQESYHATTTTSIDGAVGASAVPSGTYKQASVVAEISRPPRLRLCQQCFNIRLKRIICILSDHLVLQQTNQHHVRGTYNPTLRRRSHSQSYHPVGFARVKIGGVHPTSVGTATSLGSECRHRLRR